MSPATCATFEPRLPDVAQWFADRSLPYTLHLENALLSEEFGITSLEEMKVLQMIEWKDLLQHDPLSGEGYGVVKWRVFQEEFRKFASEEFDGTKSAAAVDKTKNKKEAKARSSSKGSSIKRSSKTIALTVASGVLVSANAAAAAAATAAAAAAAAAATAAANTKSKKQQLKMLKNDGSSKKKGGSSNANNNKSVNNTTMTSGSGSTMNNKSFLAGDTAGPAGTGASGAADLDDNEFAPKTDDYVQPQRPPRTPPAQPTTTTAPFSPSSAVPPKVTHSNNTDEQDDISTINMSSYEQSGEDDDEYNDDDDDDNTVLTLDEQKWNVKYADLLRYYKLHGTTRISLKAKPNPKHLMLRRWADKQRKKFLHDELTEDQIEKLVAIEFDFGQQVEELVAEQMEQERVQAMEAELERHRLKAEMERRLERRRLLEEKRRLEDILMQKEMDKHRLEATYVVADTEGGVEAIYVS